MLGLLPLTYCRSHKVRIVLWRGQAPRLLHSSCLTTPLQACLMHQYPQHRRAPDNRATRSLC